MPKIVKKTEELTRMVSKLSGMGITHEQICLIAGITRPTLNKYYSEELKVGKAQATATITSKLFSIATSDTKQALGACIFWLKTQAGWKETDVVEINNVSDENEKFEKLVKSVRQSKLSEKDSNESTH